MKSIEFDEYQEAIIKSDLGAPTGGKELRNPAFLDKVMGLSGETGEVMEKFKKIIRDKGGEISEEDKREIVKELGDVLWYTATISRYLGVPFSEVVRVNLDKMEGRLQRGTISGSGDNR